MRYLVLVQKCEHMKPKFKANQDTDLNPDISDCHIYDKEVYDKHRAMPIMYDSNEFLQQNYKKIFRLLHPFETINSKIKSNFIPDCPPLKITNAFMKIFEEFGGVYMTRCAWDASTRIWNYEVIIYAK